VLISSFISGKGLHPLLESTAELIRDSRKKLAELSLLDLDPELKNIYKKVDGDDFFIVNELHNSRGFRKLHLELARIGSGLQILHCVFFPEPTFNLPIFGVDLVVSSNNVSAAIVDLSPVSNDLPKEICSDINSIFDENFKTIRPLPKWGTIFSPYVCFIKPESIDEENKFLKLIERYLNALITYSVSIEPESYLSPITIERHKRQLTYCLQQKLNDKTRSVLAKTFSPNWADRYIDIVLFECPQLPPN
tara:strand:+ start:2307 stop:3053 length:747 start_codon:yes stop_codon:yes gene_type:complete